MATGTVSTLDPNQWQLVSTVTPTSGTSVTFSSLAGYKKYLIVAKNLYTSATSNWIMQFNGDTAVGAYTYSSGDIAYFQIGTGNSASPGTAMWAIIDDADKSMPHLVQAKATANTNWYQDYYVTTSAITSILISTAGGTATFTGGTIYLYGIAS